VAVIDMKMSENDMLR